MNGVDDPDCRKYGHSRDYALHGADHANGGVQDWQVPEHFPQDAVNAGQQNADAQQDPANFDNIVVHGIGVFGRMIKVKPDPAANKQDPSQHDA
jgi:hypothetical protein